MTQLALLSSGSGSVSTSVEQQEGQRGYYPRTPTPIADSCKDIWTWDHWAKSPEVRIGGLSGETAHFHPNWSNGTAAVRGTKLLNHGVHYWEIMVTQRIFGTSMMFGIGTKRSRLHADAFVNMIGEDNQSWGLSHKGLLWHNGRWRQFTKSFRENERAVVGMCYDGHQGTLTYYKDGVCLGVAFRGLNKVQEELYPIISSTAAKTEMTLGICLRGFDNLQDRCRAVIAQYCENNSVDDLPLPCRIKDYIKDMLMARR